MGKTKTICLRSLILSLLWISVVSTDATVINGINYSLDSDKGEAAVISNSPKYSGKIVIPKEVTRNGYLYRVTSIGKSAFQSCSGLTSVTIPNSVTSIGNYAFYNCSGLTSITIPNSVTSIGEGAFSSCSGLTSVTIPNSVTSIGSGAFYGCSGLTSITIPNSVTSIGESAFEYCSGLTSVTIPNSVTSIGSEAFSVCSGLTSVTIGNSVTSIGTGVFFYCYGLTSLNVEAGNTKYDSRDNCNAIIETATNTLIRGTKNTIIPNSVTSIGSEAFRNAGLTSVTIGNSVTSIGSGAFYGCSGLTSITIPNSVTSIGESAFEYCSGLTSVTIPNSVTSIGESAFENCSGLTSVTIPNSVKSIGKDAFSNCTSLTSVTAKIETPLTITNDVFTNRANASLYVPAGSYLKYKAADYWKEFKEIIINGLASPSDMLIFSDNPDGTTCSVTGYTEMCTGDVIIPSTVNGRTVTSIGSKAFRNCSGLTSVTIPNSVTSIGYQAFYGCYGLTSITIPNSVTFIGESAFEYCTSLTSVTAKIETPLTITNDVFTNRANASLYVPAGSYLKYKAADYWKEFKEIIINGLASPSDMLIFSDNPDGTTCSVTGYTEMCTGDVIIPSTVNGRTVTSIGYQAFSGCSGLTSITIPNSVTSIDINAFSGCSGLTSITIPNSVTSIGSSAFSGCSGLTSITIPNSVTYIGSAEFSWCSGLTSIIVESGNSKYDSRNNCNAIIETASKTLIVGCKNTVIPNTVTSIGYEAFYGCSGLTSITIPNSVNSIGDHAFSDCSGLTSIIVESGNSKYDSRNNCNAIIETASKTLIVGCKNTVIPNTVTYFHSYAFAGCTGLESITIPNSVTSIGYGAFFGCTGLESITIPNSVTSISERAFFGCSGLTSITIPNSVKSIGYQAFYGCSGLTSITIPQNVTYIGNYAFAVCSSLTSVTVEVETPITIPQYVFSNRANTTLYVPAGSKAKYEAADVWKEFKEIITSKTVSNPTIILSQTSYSYDGTAKEPTVTVKDGETVIPADEYTVSYSNNTNVGTATVTITDKEGGNYNVSGSTTFTINAKTVSSPTISLSQTSYTYDGTAKEPTVTVKDGETVISADEYTVSYSNNTNVGTATVTITDKEGGNYNVSGSTTFTIVGSNIVFASPEVKDACVAKWDTNKDGELSYAEAAAVTRLVDATDYDDPFAQLALAESEFTFDEFQYFTGVTSLYQEDFGGLLTSITLPNSITSIGQGAFWGCKLTSIHIPASVTEIFMSSGITLSAFSSEYLQTITVDAENTKYSSPAGSNAIIERASNTLILGCGNTDFSKIPSTVTEIGPWAFASANFTNPAITLPSSVKVINNYAFDNSNIKSINWGDLTGLTTIGTQAFYNCQGLTEVTLPTSFESMGDVVFGDCNNIVKVVSNIEEPFEIPNNDFKFCTENAVLYVPQGKVDAYISAGWEEIISDDLKSFRRIVDGDHTDPEAIEGLAYNGTDQKLILPGSYRTGMMEYSLDGSTYSTSVPTGKEAGEYTVYYRKVGLSDASILKVIIAAPKTISVFSGSNLWAGYVATENLAIPTGLKAYVITSLDATTATASPLDYIPQGVPVLLKRENTSDNNFEMSAGSGTAPTVNLLKTYESAKNVSNREGFILYNDEFVLVNEGTLPAGRVFLPANKSGVALTRGIVTEGDDTTGIYNSKMDFDDSDKQWYDLQGRKLERKPTKKGIYILDGRKVVIK